MEKPLRNRCIIDFVIHLRNVKFVVEAAPLLHIFLTVLHFYTRNACSFNRVATKTFVMISNRKQPFGPNGYFQRNISALQELNG